MTSSGNRYVIVGASAAGMAAAQVLAERDPGGRITVVCEEPDPPYFRPMIPFLISGRKSVAQIGLAGSGPYQAGGIELRLGSRVEGIDLKGQTVTVAAGKSVSFEKLLIATGSRPYIPSDIEGLDYDGVYALRTLADARSMAKRAEQAEQAVLLGGGLLNLKAAFPLLEKGLKVTLVVQSPEVLSRLMDPADSGLIRAALQKAGLRIETGVRATRILGNGQGVRAVLLNDGRELSADMVCIGKGVSPNISFINEKQIRLEAGVVVDRFTRCSAPNLFAAGDVAVTFDPITGERIMTALWTNAVEMGRCAGMNMAGRPTEYSGTFGILNATQVADQPFVSMGMVHTEGSDYEVHISESSRSYRKVIFSPDGERLVGILLIGDISRAGLYRSIIREKRAVADIKSQIINQTLHYGHLLKAKGAGRF
jgi:nitrite reductase (NADH) large subunit